MPSCTTRDTLHADYLRICSAYEARLETLTQEIGFADAVARTTGLLEECTKARYAFHEHEYAHECEPNTNSTAA